MERSLCLNRFGGLVWVERVGGTRGRRKGGKEGEGLFGERRVSGLGEGRNVGKEGKVWRRGNDVVQGDRTPYPHMIKGIWVMGHVAHPIY